MSFIKIIYFDESFVADFMQIIAGGELKKTTEFISNVNFETSADAELELNLKKDKLGIPKLLEMLTGGSISANAKASTDMAYKRDKIVKNILENTLLADFLYLLKNDKKRKDENKRCKGIHIFQSAKVKPEFNSFTFFMLAAPFMSMINGAVPIQSDDDIELTIDIKQIGEAIDNGRGYYEFISHYENEDIILRFNISAFRNNYTMSDLPKMELTYYAIYVGKSEKSKLQIQTEFEFGTSIQSRANYSGLSNNSDDNLELKVYDVVLAGIEE